MRLRVLEEGLKHLPDLLLPLEDNGLAFFLDKTTLKDLLRRILFEEEENFLLRQRRAIESE